MIGDIANIGREEGLILLMHAGSDIGPPQKCLLIRRAVVEAHFQLDHGSIRMQADAVHSLHALHRIVVAAPHGDGAIGVTLDLGLDRHEGCRPVMLRPVKLDTAGDPWTCQADECRLDDVLPIEEVVTVCLVQPDMDAAANLRQHHQTQVGILNVYRLP